MTHKHPAEGSPGAAAPITRRQFLTGAAGLGLVWAAGRSGLDRLAAAAPAPVPRPAPKGASKEATAPGTLPPPGSSGLEHIVVVMMENRSFDHFLGWLPGADGRQAGLTYLDRQNVAHPTHALAPDFQGCGLSDPDHSYRGARQEYHGAACDGWLQAGANDLYSIGYYTQTDLPFLGAHAPYWTACDRYFAAILGPTFPNRLYQYAAQTDRISNTTDISALPTIWDRLGAAAISSGYYYSDIPVLALWGTRYFDISHPLASFLTACAAGTLPHVSFVDPSLFSGDQGNDDHPHADIRNGEAFLDRVYRAVTSSPAWPNTLLIINFDEWGGFFEHVPPPAAPIPPADALAGIVDGLRGFRVPCLLISPWSPRATVAHSVYDHTSILKLIEWRWGLPPLTVRDASANNLATALDFTQSNLAAPAPVVPPGPFGGACPAGESGPDAEWQMLHDLAKQYGWPIYGPGTTDAPALSGKERTR
jgi:phospholipase C